MARYPFDSRYNQFKTAAAPVTRLQLLKFSVTPPAASGTAVLAATTLANGTTTTVATGSITNPTVARNLTVTGNQAGIAGTVLITGTNLAGTAIGETIVANGTAVVAGNKAFRTISGILLPARNGAGDTISVGTGSKIGLPVKQTRVQVLQAFLNSALEGTAPTVAINGSVVENNTVTLNSALNGNQVDIIMWG